jgi:hypothetical protein
MLIDSLWFCGGGLGPVVSMLDPLHQGLERCGAASVIAARQPYELQTLERPHGKRREGGRVGTVVAGLFEAST